MAAKLPAELTGKAAVDLFGEIPDAMDTTDGCWCAAVNLFHEIEKRHGEAVAKKMFLALASPSKRQRKRLLDSRLKHLTEILQKHHGWAQRGAMEKTAEHLLRHNVLGLPRGTTKNTLRKRINRVMKPAKK